MNKGYLSSPQKHFKFETFRLLNLNLNLDQFDELQNQYVYSRKDETR